MPPSAFPRPCFTGVVHLLALPGAPRHGGSFDAVLARARADASALVEGGCDALVVENFGDTPFHPEHVPPETVAALALCVSAVRLIAGERPVGVNVLRNDARAAIGIAAVTGASFVRVNVHTGAAVTDQGIVQGRAHETLRERVRLAPGVAILADAHVKHATQLSSESLAECIHDLVLRGLADGVIVSGRATGRPPSVEEVQEARRAAGDVPLWIGSGLDAKNARALLAHATGAIVGTALERDGRPGNPVELARVCGMRSLFDECAR